MIPSVLGRSKSYTCVSGQDLGFIRKWVTNLEVTRAKMTLGLVLGLHKFSSRLRKAKTSQNMNLFFIF